MNALKASLAAALIADGYIKHYASQRRSESFTKDGEEIVLDDVTFVRMSGVIGGYSARSGFKARISDEIIATAPGEHGPVTIWQTTDAIVAAARLLQEHGFVVTERTNAASKPRRIRA